MPPVLLALCSNISFATGSLLFTHYSRRISSMWMNFYKALVACVCFAIVCTIFRFWSPVPALGAGLLAASGLVGLMIGDIFLLKAFVHLGSGRVLMLFGFQPILLGCFSFLFFGQQFPLYRLVAVLLLIGCLVTFSLESFRKKGHWDIPGLSFAFAGVFLDAAGVLMTRGAFEAAPEMSPFMANFIRAFVCVIGFALLSRVPGLRFTLFHPLRQLPARDRLWVTLAGFLGTFMSLSFYLMAIKNGHLATISAIAGTSPLFATLFETILGRKPFSIYLLIGTSFFASGMAVLFWWAS